MSENYSDSLTELYAKMTEAERRAYGVFAVSGGSLSETDLSLMLSSGTALKLCPALKNFSISDALSDWEKSGLVQRTEQPGGRTLWSADARLQEKLRRSIAGSIWYKQYCAVVESRWRLPHPTGQGTRIFESLPQALYFLRKYYYLHDAEGLKKLQNAVFSDGSSWRVGLQIFAAESLTDSPLTDDALDVFPEETQWMLLEALWETSGSDNTRRERILGLEENLCRRTGNSVFAGQLARRLCGMGRFEKAAALRPLLDSEGLDRLAAVDCLVRGRNVEAKKYYDRLMRAPRKRNVGLPQPPDLWELFYVPLLASLNEPPDKIRRAAERGAAHSGWNCGDQVWDAAGALALISSPSLTAAFLKKNAVRTADAAIRKVLSCASGLTDGQIASELEHELFSVMDLQALTFLIFLALWAAPDTARRWAPVCAPVALRLSEQGLSFFASELNACGDTLTGRDSGGWHPLRDLIRMKPQWARSLDALESLAGNGAGETPARRGARRVLWMVDFSEVDTPELPKAYALVSVTPLEQTRLAGGRWSRGREIALSAVAKGLERIPGLSEQERRVADAVTERHIFGASRYELDGGKALLILAGNPNVVRADTLEPMEIVKAAPRLEVSAEPGGCRLRMTPANPGGLDIIVKPESPVRLYVVPFSQTQKNLCAILGSEGILIPAEAESRALKVLSRLGSTVTVQSDLSTAGVLAEQADSRLRVQLSPSGTGLNVEFTVRPFGENGISCAPGRGGASLFGTLPDGRGGARRVQVKRDLQTEEKSFRAAVEACPALNSGEQVYESRWQISDAGQCLELLLQLRALPDLIIEWPRGGAVSVRAEVDGSTLLGAAQNSGTDWFALSGTIRIDKDLTLSLKQLLSLLKQAKNRFIPVGEGQFAALTLEFRKRLEALSALTVEKGAGLEVPPLSAPAVNELFGGSLAGDRKWQDLCRRFTEAQKLEPEVPRTLRARLRPYQITGFKWLARLAHWGAGACLADDMGLGKTVQALALLLHRADGGPALIVAPTSVCGSWLDEAARFAPTLNFLNCRGAEMEKLLQNPGPLDVVLTSYGMLQTHSELFAAVNWNTIILDEAQAVKNMGTKRSEAVMGLHGSFRMIMTGTPVENHLSELWNLFRFINPGLLGSLASFTHRFAAPIVEGDSRARSQLHKTIAPFLLRRVKEQVLDDLPERTEVTLKIDLSEQERSFYEALRQSASEAVEAAGALPDEDRRFVIFAQLMKLRRCCCAVSLVSKSVGASIASSKLTALLNLALQMRENGHRALIFSQFVDHLRLIRTALEDQGFDCLYLDGATPAARRTDLVRSFQSGHGDCFLISLRAGGTGLNLTGADCVIHMDPWWNPAVEDQASDRAYRIGQTRPVTVYRLVARNTVEEKIVELHRAKRRLAEALLEGTAQPASLSLEELAALICG
jgi:hypothetical protein